jgi:hypothetical protein
MIALEDSAFSSPEKKGENDLIKRKMSDFGRPGVTGPKELSAD